MFPQIFWLVFTIVKREVLGLFVVVFCWGFLSSAGVVNCINLLSTQASAGVSTRQGVGDLHSWRAEGKAEKILQKGKPSISRRAACGFDSVLS